MTREDLLKIVEEVSHYLPAQAPIGAFVHHNTLHAFESKPFHEAVAKAHDILGGSPYLELSEFRRLYRTGRITVADINDVLEAAFPQSHLIIPDLTTHALYRTLLLYDIDPVDKPYIAWSLAQKKLLDNLPSDFPQEQRTYWQTTGTASLANIANTVGHKAFISQLCRHELGIELEEHWGISATQRDPHKLISQRTDACLMRYLWGECLRLVEGIHHVDPSEKLKTSMTRRIMAIREELHSILIRLSASFMDTGVAYWPMPAREQGFYNTVRHLFPHSFSLAGSWMQDACSRFDQQAQEHWSAEETVFQLLQELGFKTHRDAHDFLLRELLALPGWAGMFYRLQKHSQDRLRSFPYSLMDFLAVRLTLTAAMLAHSEDIPVETLMADTPASPLQPAYLLFRVFLYAPVSLDTVAGLQCQDAKHLLQELETFGVLQRQALFQEAYERHYRVEILDAVGRNALLQQELQQEAEQEASEVQMVFCIDDREESLRRHLEEYKPLSIETYGALGFFNLPIRYQSLVSARGLSLCPIVVEPKYCIREVAEDREAGRRWKSWWSRVNRWGLAGYVGTKNMFRGFLFSLAGILEAIPMLLWLIWPAWGHRFRSFFYHRTLRAPRTTLTHLKTAQNAQTDAEEICNNNPAQPLGLPLEDAIHLLQQQFQDMGLTSTFRPLVLILGHGATTINNPHEAAYECGACRGGKGGANARLFASLANDPEVRTGLKQKGIDIPDTTVFVGGIHDSTNDTVALYDLHKIPPTHELLLKQSQEALAHAGTLNAHERCRRFESFSLSQTPQRSFRSVQNRCHNLAEPRQEYGHCTNAVCIIGRRWFSRGLFLDRRSFLMSYDPHQDPDGRIVERLLLGVAPVGGGINLEYYFSRVDQDIYGCGTKLPHNITGLVGVMNGPESDLRTGLPYQMIEIHEPMRLLLIVESSTERLLEITERNPMLKRLVLHNWLQLVAMHPDTHELSFFEHGTFQPYQPKQSLTLVPSSFSYYRGHREHLPPVRVASGEGGLSLA